MTEALPDHGLKRGRPKRKPPPWPVFEDDSRELNFEMASETRDERAMGNPVKHFAAEFGVSTQVIEDVIERRVFGDARWNLARKFLLQRISAHGRGPTPPTLTRLPLAT